ncbi:MAG: carbamoyltransferase HypF [Acidobacteria bacterium]|nr:carbamoyltransferase HypF [Acidobacteriota bacterium]
MLERRLIEVRGNVQGVGFRPHVYSLASTLGLRGFARNRGAHLVIDLEGEPEALGVFLDRLAAAPPPRAVIEQIDVQRAAPAFHRDLSIAGSLDTAEDIRIPPDTATCGACLAEMDDPADRRFRYPFINCQDCGPRFTIVTGAPYDRPRTTMSGFAMCGDCRREYEDPRNRRFHAQPIACPRCGPRLAARDSRSGTLLHDRAHERGLEVLAGGGILALKGLGGYHLACDAASHHAVDTLRARKRRDARPLAVMIPPAMLAQVLDGAAAAAAVIAAVEAPERPVVLVDRRLLAAAFLERLAPGIAPGCPAIGLMLPYTPLHHMLVRDYGGALVMTSGNRAGDPLAFEDEDAWTRLRGIADLFLVHDRPIHTRCDDSVVAVVAGGVTPIRRARGHAPAPLLLAEAAPEPVLAVGGHLKNTFCLMAGRHATMSPHVGDLENASSYAALAQTVAHYSDLLRLAPAVVVHDLHPGYLSTRFAEEYPAELRIGVQHHHAHVLSCAAEHGETEPVIGVAFDGSGLGTDGAIWGGEFLLVEGERLERLAHLAYVPLAGGEAAVREPWRMALAHVMAAGGVEAAAAAARLADRVPSRVFGPVGAIIGGGIAQPRTSSVGRLFDAVAALLGVRDRALFEGQAAMELEALATDAGGLTYRFDLSTAQRPWTLEAAPVIRAIAAAEAAGEPKGRVAAAFQDALARAIADVAGRLAAQTGVRRIALTGGVFQNTRLTAAAAAALAARGLDVLLHRRVPCNDGGLSLGQAVFAARVIRRGASGEGRAPCV